MAKKLKKSKKLKKPVRPTLLDLNVLHRTHEIAPSWLGDLLRSSCFFTFDLPTEFVLHPVDEEGSRRKIGDAMRLMTGRVYRTGLYNHRREFVTHGELHARIPKAARKALGDGLLSGPSFGKYQNCELFVAEVWSDHGSDGHVEYELIGHMLYIEQHLERSKEGPLYRRIETLAYDAEDRSRKAQELREREEAMKAREVAVAKREFELAKSKEKQ